MMRYLFLPILAILAACNSPKKDPIEKRVVSTYQDGTPKKVSVYNAETNEVVSETEHYENNKTFREWHYERGLKNGESRSFYESGGPWSLNTYVNDTLDGPYKTWHENGKLFMDGQYTMGVRSGVWRFYAPDGTLSKEEDFDKSPSIPASE